MPTTLAIADHQEIVRLGLRSLIDGSPIEVTDEAANEKELWRLLNERLPGVLILNAQFADEDGFLTLAKLKEKWPDLPVLVWADGDNLTYLARAIALKASGYIPRTVRPGELIEQINTAAAGKRAWSAEQLARFTGTPDLPPECPVDLTPKERELLRQLGYGLSNLEIAAAMGIGYETVKEHVQHCFRKLGVNGRVPAAIWAIKNGLC